jgi:small subunit ribosomal protein S1
MMELQHKDRKKNQSEMPGTDEGWWESVLAEEQQYSSPRPQTVVRSKPVAYEKKPLSPAPAQQADWDLVKQLYAEDRILEMKATGHNRGGLLVEHNGLAGFVPFSHLVDLAGKINVADRDPCLEAYMGKTLSVKVIECAPEDGRVVFSERAALTQPGKRNELFHSLYPGAQVTGRVTNITDFGVFVDLGGVEGLIHISELSWGRVSHPNQIVRLDEEIQIQVLEISLERNRVALSLKRLIPNPWERATSGFAVGSILPAVITAVLSYGAFARLELGVEGLIHASEIPLAENQSLHDLLSEGQAIQVRVLQVDPTHQRLGFSMRLNLE